jgi:hypothetical protein
MKRLKSPYITSSESFLSQIEPTDSADEAISLASGMGLSCQKQYNCGNSNPDINC